MEKRKIKRPEGGWGLRGEADRKNRIEAFSKFIQKYPDLNWKAEPPKIAAQEMIDTERRISKRGGAPAINSWDKVNPGQSEAEKKLWSLAYKDWRDNLVKKKNKKAKGGYVKKYANGGSVRKVRV